MSAYKRRLLSRWFNELAHCRFSLRMAIPCRDKAFALEAFRDVLSELEWELDELNTLSAHRSP